MLWHFKKLSIKQGLYFETLDFNLTMNCLYFYSLFKIFTVKFIEYNYNKITFLLPDTTTGLRPPSVFFVHSESMAEQENVSALESFDNPGPSTG